MRGGGALLVLTVALRSPGLLVIWLLVISDLRINNRLRLAIGILVEATAFMMMSAGIGKQQGFWVNVLDLVLMTLFNLVFLLRAYNKKFDGGLSEPDNRPKLSSQARWRWFGAYAALIAFLAVMLHFSAGLLPPAMTA